MGVVFGGEDDFEVGTFDFSEFGVEVGHAGVGGGGDGPGEAVVGDEHAVAFEGGDDCFRVRREFGVVEIGAEAEAFSHAGEGGVFIVAGEVSGGVGVGATGFAEGDAEGVVDDAALEFVETDDGGEDGETGGVGGGPGFGAEGIGTEVEDCGTGGGPACVGFFHLVELIEFSGLDIDDESVSVAAFFAEIALVLIEGEGREFFSVVVDGIEVVDGPAFDGGVAGDGIGAGVGFVGEFPEGDFDFFLRRIDEDEVHVGVHAEGEIRADGLDDLRGVGVEGPIFDEDVPVIVGGEDFEAGENGIGIGGVEGDRFFDLNGRG